MLKWKKILIGLFSLLAFQNLFACGLCSGNGYIGTYSMGGHNLYSFTTDIYTIIDTTYSEMPLYGGGCGSLLSGCNACNSSPSLYGGSSASNPDTQLINQLLISQINQNTLQMCMVSGMCNPINPYLPINGPVPPMIPPVPPISGITPPPYYPPVVTPSFPNDPNSPYNPNNPYNPFYPYPPSIPPVTQLPYGGCDNVIVMCPIGPITPVSGPSGGFPPISSPPTTPVTGTPPQRSPGITYPPSYQGGSQTLPQSPTRYQTPRGATMRTH